MVDAQKQIGLHELGLDGRGPDGDDGLLGEDRGALGDGPDVAGKAEISEVGKKFLAEHLPAPEIGDVLLGKVQILNVVHDLFQSCGNGEAAAVGALAEEEIEVGNAVAIAAGEVALAHGQLIKIAEHGEVEFFSLEHRDHLKNLIDIV